MRTKMIQFAEQTYARLWSDILHTGDGDLLSVFKELLHMVQVAGEYIYSMDFDMFMCILDDLDEHGVCTVSIRNLII